jgi:hypothetical protein
MTMSQAQKTERAKTNPLAPDDPRHGTANGYNNYLCRCEPCRQAWATYTRETNHRRGINLPRAERIALQREEAEARDYHGTENGYTKHRCRCHQCTEAANWAKRLRRDGLGVTKHGTHGGYTNGCRCDQCRTATLAYRRDLRERKRQAKLDSIR